MNIKDTHNLYCIMVFQFDFTTNLKEKFQKKFEKDLGTNYRLKFYCKCSHRCIYSSTRVAKEHDACFRINHTLLIYHKVQNRKCPLCFSLDQRLHVVDQFARRHAEKISKKKLSTPEFIKEFVQHCEMHHEVLVHYCTKCCSRFDTIDKFSNHRIACNTTNIIVLD